MLKDHPLYIFKDFRNLFLGRVISAIGDKFFQIALIWWAMGEENGKFNVGLIMSANFLPIVLFGPFLGTYVDKSNKKINMLVADFFRAILVFTLSLFFYLKFLNFYIALTIIFLISFFAPLFESSVASSLLRLTSQKHLSQATAIDSSSMQISNVFGAAIGSIFISIIGIGGAFLFNGFTYLISFLFVFMIKTNLAKENNINKKSYKEDLKDGISYLIKNHPILYLVMFFSILNFFISPIFILIPMIVKYIINESASWLAIFETFFAIGLTTMSLILSFKENYSKPYINLFYSIFIAGIFFFALFLTHNKYLLIIFLTLMGASISLGNVVILSLFQNNINEEFKGRFFSLITTISYSIIPISFITNSFIAEKFSVEIDIIANSVAVIILSFILKNFSWKIFELKKESPLIRN